ncbi:MAG: TIGR04149 family rSAM-modified RiPP [Sediminibacterium sp.]|nr:TIGR04149 family rSAM-modified RiPP [Sediminibacterium sp.]
MKKLRLSLQQLEKAEVLTQSQLKAILGGDGSGPLGICQKSGEACWLYVNCCSGLSCLSDHNCH